MGGCFVEREYEQAYDAKENNEVKMEDVRNAKREAEDNAQYACPIDKVILAKHPSIEQGSSVLRSSLTSAVSVVFILRSVSILVGL